MKKHNLILEDKIFLNREDFHSYPLKIDDSTIEIISRYLNYLLLNKICDEVYKKMKSID